MLFRSQNDIERLRSHESETSEDTFLNQKPTFTSSDLLFEELKRFHKRQEEKEKTAVLQGRLVADSQVFGALSVIVSSIQSISGTWYTTDSFTKTIFIASLSVAFLSLAHDTFTDNITVPKNSTIPNNDSLLHPNTEENVYSCIYMATALSLVAGCLSGLSAALRNVMAQDVDKSMFQKGSKLDRTLSVVLLFVSVMMALSVVSFVVGLLLFVWIVQGTFVAVVMSTPCTVFLLAIAFTIVLYAVL